MGLVMKIRQIFLWYFFMEEKDEKVLDQKSRFIRLVSCALHAAALHYGTNPCHWKGSASHAYPCAALWLYLWCALWGNRWLYCAPVKESAISFSTHAHGGHYGF